MNILASLFHRPGPAPVRYVVATRQESLVARRRQADRLIELAVYKATTTPEERRLEADIAMAALRAEAVRSSVHLPSKGEGR